MPRGSCANERTAVMELDIKTLDMGTLPAPWGSHPVPGGLSRATTVS